LFGNGEVWQAKSELILNGGRLQTADFFLRFLLTRRRRLANNALNQTVIDHELVGFRDKYMKRVISILLSSAFLISCNSFGKDAPKANPFNETLSAVPAAELPAKAADLVLQTKSRTRLGVTVNVVKSAVGIQPAAACAIVGAISRAVPEMASVAAGAAAAEQPKQASAIAKAAAAAAPTKAGQIVLAVCRAVPNAYRDIAIAVSQAVPSASREIVSAVGSAMPELKPAIAKALAGYGGSMPSVTDILTQAADATALSAAAKSDGSTIVARGPVVRGPAVGPPYIPPSKTATNVTSGTAGKVPTGGRNYAAP
jgi:hypothetical protein